MLNPYTARENAQARLDRSPQRVQLRALVSAGWDPRVLAALGESAYPHMAGLDPTPVPVGDPDVLAAASAAAGECADELRAGVDEAWWSPVAVRLTGDLTYVRLTAQADAEQAQVAAATGRFFRGAAHTPFPGDERLADACGILPGGYVTANRMPAPGAANPSLPDDLVRISYDGTALTYLGARAALRNYLLAVRADRITAAEQPYLAARAEAAAAAIGAEEETWRRRGAARPISVAAPRTAGGRARAVA